MTGGNELQADATLEDLRAALEELRQQNEELAAAHIGLENERRRYHELFHLAPDAYLLTDLAGVVSEANLAASRLLKVENHFLEGKALALFVAKEDRPRFRNLLTNAGRGTTTHTAAFRLEPGDGGPISIEATYSLIVQPKAKPTGIRWLMRSVTDREQLAGEIQELIHREEEARRAAEASEAQSRHVQKLESIGVLAGGIAHDFNNLLHVVLGNADIALSNLSADSPARDALEEVVRATLRAADLTRQLLAYSGKGTFVVRHLDLSSEVREMATLLRTAISKQATLTWELAPDLPAINADPTQIRQIVMNLITNASDALAERGGTITLRTGVTLLKELEGQRFSVPMQGDELLERREDLFVFLEIGDTGVGMSPDTLSRIFDPFFSTKFAGRGLGLAAVMGIVRSHHGLIRIRTERDEGTAFRVLFPPVSGTAVKPEKPSAERSDWRGSGTILVIEDEEGVREVVERMLEEIGFQTIGAEDGRHALDVMERVGDSVTAVLLDLSMPRMGGAETLRRLRALRPELPVLMMSGYTEQSVSPQFGDSGPGPTGFLQKPFLAEDLIAVLRRFAEASN
ncbi:MAG TPA: response regulator [Gemmatimonadales bacterium]|nr:response regulator [Gemmatimonadales bacterium]